jgi:hypothetical protein
MLALDAIASSTITKYLQQWRFLVLSFEPPTTILDDAILDAFGSERFSFGSAAARVHLHSKSLTGRSCFEIGGSTLVFAGYLTGRSKSFQIPMLH